MVTLGEYTWFSDFVTSASCIPDAQKKTPKMQNYSWYASHGTQRSADRSEDVFVEYPVHVISVAVVAAVV